MRAIIVDDEQQSHEVLNNLLSHGHHDIKVVASAYNVAEGLNMIAFHNPDLVFLDVEMPDGTGFDLLTKIGRPDFHIIFITAYNKYAQNAIRFGALDFLLKPLDPELLDSALDKLREKQEEKNNIEQWRLAYLAFQQFRKNQLPDTMTVSTMEGVYFIHVKDIIHFIADGNTTDIHIDGWKKPLIASVNIGEFVKQFELYPNFMRVHRSHLVNLDYVSMYVRADGGYLVMKDGCQVPVSRGFRDGLLGQLGV